MSSFTPPCPEPSREGRGRHSRPALTARPPWCRMMGGSHTSRPGLWPGDEIILDRLIATAAAIEIAVNPPSRVTTPGTYPLGTTIQPVDLVARIGSGQPGHGPADRCCGTPGRAGDRLQSPRATDPGPSLLQVPWSGRSVAQGTTPARRARRRFEGVGLGAVRHRPGSPRGERVGESDPRRGGRPADAAATSQAAPLES